MPLLKTPASGDGEEKMQERDRIELSPRQAVHTRTADQQKIVETTNESPS
jgi:hypothetical protein